MGLRRARVEDFFGPTAAGITLLAERTRWIGGDPGRYTAFPEASHPLLLETVSLARQHGVCPPSVPAASSLPAARLGLLLASGWEPDFLLLDPSASGEFVLTGGAVCFPSRWDLAGKLGLGVRAIHAVAPGLNDELGSAIDRFLSRIPPGASFERHNWGLSASPELNQHPSRDLPLLGSGSRLDDTWLRVERQSFVSLPESGGLLFAIRVRSWPLDHLKHESPSAAQGLARALSGMPADVAFYKGLASARVSLARLLEI